MHEVYYNTSFRILQAFFEKIFYFFGKMFFMAVFSPENAGAV